MKKNTIRTSALKPEDFASLSLRQAVVQLKAGNRLWVLRAASGEGDVFSAEDPWAEIESQLGLTREAAQQEGWVMTEVKPRDVKPLLPKKADAKPTYIKLKPDEVKAFLKWKNRVGLGPAPITYLTRPEHIQEARNQFALDIPNEVHSVDLYGPDENRPEVIALYETVEDENNPVAVYLRKDLITKRSASTKRTAEDAAPVPPAEKKEEGETTTPAVKAEPHQYGALSKKLSTAVGPALSEILGEFGPELYNGVVTSIKGALKTAFEATLEQVENTVKEELGAQGLKVAQQYYRSWLDELTADLKQHGFDDASVAVEDIASDLAAAFPTEQAADENVPDLGEMKPAGEEEDLMPVEETPDLEPVDLAPPTPEIAPAAPVAPAPAAPVAPAGAGPVDLLAPTADVLQPRQYRRKTTPTRR